MQSSKADLSEIFAAMSGVVHAGCALQRAKKEKDNRALVDAAVATAIRAYDARRAVALAEGSAGKQNAIGAQCLADLAALLPVLQEFPLQRLVDTDGKKGGTVGDVIEHISDMMTREAGDVWPRAAVPFAVDGSIKMRFKKAYLPEYARARKNGSAPGKRRPVHEEAKPEPQPFA